MGKTFMATPGFPFSIVDGQGSVTGNILRKTMPTIENFVLNGRYLVLLGRAGHANPPRLICS